MCLELKSTNARTTANLLYWRLFSRGKRLNRMKKTKAALFGASWWPYASYEELRIATYLSIWASSHCLEPYRLLTNPISIVCLGWRYESRSHKVFVLNEWYTETDSLEFSPLAYDLERATQFREETLSWILKCLEPDADFSKIEAPSSSIIANFQPVGAAITDTCTPSKYLNLSCAGKTWAYVRL